MTHRGSWIATALVAALVALAQVAGASTRSDTSAAGGTIDATVAADRSDASHRVALPKQASATALEESANGLATANASISASGRTKTETTTNEDEHTVGLTSAAAPKDGTAGASTRPGFGCGDTNHKHLGPPGRPGATPPPGCTKH
jgi:hypothetical protein